VRTSKRGRGSSPNEELGKKIGKMWDAGSTQLEIADALEVSTSAVRFHLQKVGIPNDQQHKSRPLVRGKRACVQCKASKELNLYPSPRHAICTACIHKNLEEKKH
jgi:hypothetical protein